MKGNDRETMKWLWRVTWLYLLIPFIMFCLGWFSPAIALPIAMFMLWVLWRLWGAAGSTDERLSPLDPAILIMTGIWVFLSGVGGYAFQNWDHHWRNAVFRDLITYDWPVVYSSIERGPVKMLVYYFGYWLPAALAGKLLGWKIASLLLFLWTWLGILLTVLHLNLKLKTSMLRAALLLIFFSGMDALGTLLFASDYPTLWPATQHLEIWSGDLQYSSFTTQLFWVFNQAVPAWLCVILIASKLKPGQAVLIWGLSFFLAPLASPGLLVYMLIDWFEAARIDIKGWLKNFRFELLIAAVLVVAPSYLYFSSNTAAQERGFQLLPPGDLLIFLLLEGGVLWLLLAPRLRREPRWVATGLLLFSMPFIQFGSGRDFVMRASITPLFFLMIWCGETIFQHLSPRFFRIAMIVILFVGALTPLYEINRSIQRTFEYYFLLDVDQRIAPNVEPLAHLEQPGAPEDEHPGMLVADDIHTLAFMTDQLSKNFIANVRQSLYILFAPIR
jgi:hypothetical protein